jgi:hypothetical protein
MSAIGSVFHEGYAQEGQMSHFPRLGRLGGQGVWEVFGNGLNRLGIEVGVLGVFVGIMF